MASLSFASQERRDPLSEEITRLSAAELVALIARRALSPVEVVEAFRRRADDLNPRLNAIVTISAEATEQARRAEAEIMRGAPLGPLHGLPFTVKDTIETAGLRTTSGSRVRAAHLPLRDAPAIARLRAAGAILLGKTNVSEMAMDHTNTENPLFGRTENPRRANFSAGGSSGGEAAAVAARLTPVGLGSDLTGSIRIPAHFCGVAGLKPTTPGLIPRDGQYPPASGIFSLGASIGPLASNVTDLALCYNALAAQTPSQKEILSDLRGMRAAFYTSDGTTPVTEETIRAVADAARALGQAGVIIEEARPPGVERGPDLWFALFADQAARFLRETYAGREEEAGPFVRLMLARREKEEAAPPQLNELLAAWAERDRLLFALEEWMRRTPLIIAPVGATPACAHGTRRVVIRGQPVSLRRSFTYAQTYNVFGLPAVAVPAGSTADGLPVGVQIIAPAFAETLALDAARVVEEARLFDGDT